MEITRSLAQFLESRLVCVYFANGSKTFGIFGGKSGDSIFLSKPCLTQGNLRSERIKYEQWEIEKIMLADDLQTAYALNVGIKVSKKVRQALDKKFK
jgi:hypothetical protein